MLRGPGGRRLARAVTDVLSPAPVVAALVLAIAVHSAHTAREALVQAVIALVFGSLLPFAFVAYQVHARRITDVHVGDRRQRPQVMAVSLVLFLVGFGLLLWTGAEPPLLAAVVAGLSGTVVCLLVTLRWKISIHMTVLGGSCMVGGLALGPWWWLAGLLTIPVGWSRVRLTDHTVAQVLAGGVVGTLVAGTVYLLVMRML